MNYIKQLLNKPLIKDSINTTFLRVIARSIGLLIPFFIAAWFGISDKTDAFFYVYGIVIFITSVFANTLETFMVPYIGEMRAKKESDVAPFITLIFSTSILSIITIIGLTLISFKLLLPFITKFDPAQLILIYQLLIKISPLFIFITLSSILCGALNAYNHFKSTSISPAFRSIITLGFIFIFKSKWGIDSIAFGYVLGEFFRLIILYLACLRRHLIEIKGFHWKLTKDLKNFYKTVFQRILGMLAISFNPIIDKTMASWLGAGSISILNYADKIFSIPVIFLVEGFMVVLLSHWTKIQYEGEGLRSLKKQVFKTCKIISIISVIICILLYIQRVTLANFIFGNRLIESKNLTEIANVLGYYLIGFIPLMLVMTIGRAFIVLKKGGFLMMTGFINCGLNILFNFLFMKKFGLAGIALSTSAVQFIIVIIFLIYWHKLEYKTS